MVDLLDGGNAASDFEEDQPGFVGTFSNSTRTGNEVATAVRRQFGDDAGVQVDDSDILRWINDAQDTIANRNKFLKATSVMVAQPGRKSYRWPDERILEVESIHYDGRRVPNVPFPAAERHMNDTDVSTGCPKLWYEWAGAFTFWPAPADEKEITLYLTLKPPAITDMGSVLSIPDKYFPDVVRYVLLQAYEMDEDWEAVKAKQQQFDSSVGELADEERIAQNMSYETITVVDDGYW